MVTTYGNFPGVKADVAGGGITSVAVGDNDKLVLFGAADYQNDGTFPSDGEDDPLVSTLDGSAETPTQVNARREANREFGENSELADAMRESLANGQNIDFLYGVAPRRTNVVDEVQSTQSGSLANAPIVEDDVADESDIENIVVTDTTDGSVEVRYDYASPPSQPSDTDVVHVNPHTGEYAADSGPAGDYNFDYKYLQWESAFNAADNVVIEGETGVYDVVTEADSVSSTLDSIVYTGDSNNPGLRDRYQMVNALSGAQPNANELVEDDSGNYVRRDARFDTGSFSKGSVDSDYYFKFAPVRKKDSSRTILGGIGGLFAGNELSNPIYNDELFGYDELEQSFTKTDADNMRENEVIPIRQAGSIRVKDNLSTSTETDWERDFWRRRIVDTVILIAKQVGDTILGEINDPNTRATTNRLIRSEIRELVDDRLLRPNTDTEQRWFVDVYEDSENVNEVNIDIGVTPYGIVKQVDASITINT